MTLLKNLFGRKDSISEHAEAERCASCGRIKVKGSRLEFISSIKRDGSGTYPVDVEIPSLNDTIFTLTSLSITNGTYIASEFNSFVVKLKNN